MKKLIILYLFLGICIGSFALPRDRMQAQNIAQQFIEETSVLQTKSTKELTLVNGTNNSLLRSQSQTPTYYIYNIGDNEGFVIVSGDDCVKEILAYSNEGSIDLNNLPPNLKYWLDFYADEINYAIENGFPSLTVETETKKSLKKTGDALSPLLGDLKWNQGDPYNLLCPLDAGSLSVTGCVATAMAMIMKYYEYPTTGIGSHSYTVQSLNRVVSANFGGTTYDWANMTPQYNANSTDIQKQAVSTLMLHCGVAVEMNYTSGESGAIQYKIAQGLINFFGYNPNITVEGRNYCSQAEWEYIIREELAAGRPIPYSGQTTDNAGHSFILDGYDENGKYHFNWGWGGYADGYYEITSLSPGSGGIGGGSGSYNVDQHILLGVQPTTTGELKSHWEVDNTITASKLSYSRSERMSLVSNLLWNMTPNFNNGKLGLALYQNGVLVTELSDQTTISLAVGLGYRNYTINGTVPASVPNGTYQLYMFSKNVGEPNPSIIKAPKGTHSYYDAVITDANITLTVPSLTPSLTQINLTSSNSQIVRNENATFNLTLKNEGSQYFDAIGIYMRKVGSVSKYQRIESSVNIAPGEEKTIEIPGLITVEAGDYRAVMCYKSGTTWYNADMNTYAVTFTVLESSGIDDEYVNNSEFSTYTNGNRLFVVTDDKTPIYIYSTTGVRIGTIIPDGSDNSITLPNKGIYIVKQQLKSAKVIY